LPAFLESAYIKNGPELLSKGTTFVFWRLLDPCDGGGVVLVTKISSLFSADIPAENPQHRIENLRAWGGKLGAVPAISGPFLVKTCDK
jgi:hypothetical protein